MKDPTLVGPSSANFITIDRYHVKYIRADGRNTQGVDVPYPFDGAITGTVTDDGAIFGFTLVRHQAKVEAPLGALAVEFRDRVDHRGSHLLRARSDRPGGQRHGQDQRPLRELRGSRIKPPHRVEHRRRLRTVIFNMKRTLSPARTILGIVLSACLASAACTMKNQEAPPLAGPSEYGTAITITVKPDQLTQDGASQSLVTITARDPFGNPLPNLSLRAEIFVDGSRVDFGSLSARNLVTDPEVRRGWCSRRPRPPRALRSGRSPPCRSS